MAPDADQEGHGDQHDLPEEEEEEQVEGKENTDHTDFQKQQCEVEFLNAVMHAVPGSEHADRREECRQDDQEHADAIHAEVIIDGRRGDPMAKFDQRVAGSVDGDHAQQEQRENEFRRGNSKRHPANPEMIVAAQQEKRGGPKSREEDQDGKEMAAEYH